MTTTTLNRPSLLVSIALCSAALALGGCNKRTGDDAATSTTTPGATSPSTGATPGTSMASSPGMSSPGKGASAASGVRP